MPPPRPDHRVRDFRLQRAFTIIELLVVISIIGVVTGLAFPTLRATLQNTAVNVAVGQVNNALSAARVFATQNRPFLAARRVGQTLRTSDDLGDGYSGAIVLFANDNSLRIMRNDENAWDDENNRWMELLPTPLNGYTPVEDFEDQRFNGRVQVFGIHRVGPAPEDVQLIPPPFAIRFNRSGVITSGNLAPSAQVPAGGETPGMDPNPFRVVFVSEDGETQPIGTAPNAPIANNYRISNLRTNGNADLDPAEFGPGGSNVQPDGRVALPFGRVETVSGVLVVEPDRVPAELDAPGGPTGIPIDLSPDNIRIRSRDVSNAVLAWAQDNPTFGRILFFNRFTGQDLTR